MTTFGKYQVLELIGEGGFSRVYQGFDPTLKRHVAIKVVSLTAPQARERFMREAEIAASLRHPHIVTIFDFGEENGQPYLVQEFLPGRDLDALIRSGDTGDLRTRIGYLLQAGEGLHHAHTQGIVHRDVKPGNLRILGDGSVRVMDFGIAKTRDTEHDLTATGMSVGTSGYLAPEQLEGTKIDHRADIFSFGVVAYELLTGKKPFPGETVTAVLYRILNEEPVAILALAPETPARLASCIDRCLRKSRDERPASLEQVMAELRTVLAELDAPAWQSPAADTAPGGATAAFLGDVPGPEPVHPGTRVATGPAEPTVTEPDPWIRTRRYVFIVGAVIVIAAGLWAAVSVARAVSAGDPGPVAVTDSGSADVRGLAAVDSASSVVDDQPPARDTSASVDVDAAGSVPGPAPDAVDANEVTQGDEAEPPDTVTPPPPVAIDTDRIVLLLDGDVPDAVRLAETTLLGELTMRGRTVVEGTAVTGSRAAAVARRAAGRGEVTPIAALGREFGAATVVVGTLLVDATMAVAGIVTGSAVLEARFYDSVTGDLILAERFQVGAGGVPGRAGSTELDAISQATEAVARQAARAILRQTGSGR